MAFILVRDADGATAKAKVDAFNDGTDDVILQKFGVSVTYTDRSGTITTGNTAQQMMAANTKRRKIFIKNPATATESLWIRFTGTAAVGGASSIELQPGDAWGEAASEGVTPQAVSVVATTTAHAFFALEGE